MKITINFNKRLVTEILAFVFVLFTAAIIEADVWRNMWQSETVRFPIKLIASLLLNAVTVVLVAFAYNKLKQIKPRLAVYLNRAFILGLLATLAIVAIYLFVRLGSDIRPPNLLIIMIGQPLIVFGFPGAFIGLLSVAAIGELYYALGFYPSNFNVVFIHFAVWIGAVSDILLWTGVYTLAERLYQKFRNK